MVSEYQTEKMFCARDSTAATAAGIYLGILDQAQREVIFWTVVLYYLKQFFFSRLGQYLNARMLVRPTSLTKYFVGLGLVRGFPTKLGSSTPKVPKSPPLKLGGLHCAIWIAHQELSRFRKGNPR